MAYTQIATIATDDHHTLQEFRASVGAEWPFLSDPERTVQKDLAFKGYRVTCFTNEEEEAVGVASKATWLLETELKEKIGVDFSRGEIWKPYMVEDRNLVTGQNPHSAAVLGRRLLEVLAGHGASREQPQLPMKHSRAMPATV